MEAMAEMKREVELRTRALEGEVEVSRIDSPRRKTKARGEKGHARGLLDHKLENVLLDLGANVLRDLLPHLAILEDDPFSELDSGELADLEEGGGGAGKEGEKQTRWRTVRQHADLSLLTLSCHGSLTPSLGDVATIS